MSIFSIIYYRFSHLLRSKIPVGTVWAQSYLGEDKNKRQSLSSWTALQDFSTKNSWNQTIELLVDVVEGAVVD